MRPQTYEDAGELEILGYVFSGRSGPQNTSFAILDPEGKKLTRGSRSPSMTFGSAQRFAAGLARIAGRYREGAKPIAALPVVRDLRLGLNVAAADMRPLVVVRGADAADARRLGAEVAKVAWSEERAGTCHYVVLEGEATFGGLTPEVGVTVVQPDPHGRGGAVLAHVGRGAQPAALAAGISSGVAAHDVATRVHRAHVREARRRGISWETAIPVSDDHGRRGGPEERRGDGPPDRRRRR
ncbi:MAG: hypothetical protein VX460_07405 [Planctomycetota bacterium]|nr:hypothetical protein [Planctomycetota bacterium]